MLHHSAAASLEEWISTKDCLDDKLLIGPKWHIPCNEEIQFANELLNSHLEGGLDDLQKIWQSKVHSDPGAVILIFWLTNLLCGICFYCLYGHTCKIFISARTGSCLLQYLVISSV